MATVAALMTIEQYLRTSFRPDVDFVDGEIEERHVGEKDHGRLQLMIGAWFAQREATLSLKPVSELRLLVASERVRICDVAVISTEAPDEQVPTIPPFLCVEIMSPEDRLSRAIKVLEDYRAMGVPHIWLIDPQEGLAYTFGTSGLQQQEDLVMRAGDGVAMDVNELFVTLDKKKNKEKA